MGVAQTFAKSIHKMRPCFVFTLLVAVVDHLQGKPGRRGKGGMCLSESEVSQLCLEGTTFETSLKEARAECASGGRRPQGGRPQNVKPAHVRPQKPAQVQGRDLVENRRAGRYSKCKPVEKVGEKWEALFEEENCVLVRMGLRLNCTSPLDLEKYEMVTNSIDSSLSALIHPNSTTMRRCIDKTTSVLTRKLIKCWGGYTEEEHSLLVKFAVGSAIANCFRLTLNQGCVGMVGVKLGREEMGMRELRLKDIEEQLFDREMAVEEELLDY